jgi:hypothetical protein
MLNDPTGQPHLSDTVLDRAIAQLVPHAPDETRRFLRAPLKRWHTAAVKFLRSKHDDFALIEFNGALLLLPAGYPADLQRWIGFMVDSLLRKLVYVEPPHTQDSDISDVLRVMLEKLFGTPL